MMNHALIYLPLVFLVLAALLLGFFALVLRDALNNRPSADTSRSLRGLAKIRHYGRIQWTVSQVDAHYEALLRQWFGAGTIAGLALIGAVGAAMPEFSGWGGVTFTWWWLILAICAAGVAILGWQKLQQAQFAALDHLRLTDAKRFKQLSVAIDYRWLGQLLTTSKYLFGALGLFFLAIASHMLISYLGY